MWLESKLKVYYVQVMLVEYIQYMHRLFGRHDATVVTEP